MWFFFSVSAHFSPEGLVGMLDHLTHHNDSPNWLRKLKLLFFVAFQESGLPTLNWKHVSSPSLPSNIQMIPFTFWRNESVLWISKLLFRIFSMFRRKERSFFHLLLFTGWTVKLLIFHAVKSSELFKISSTGCLATSCLFIYTETIHNILLTLKPQTY